MIPRTIHYCWFGDKEKPAEVLRMIANWQKHCPGYEIKEWNGRSAACKTETTKTKIN